MFHLCSSPPSHFPLTLYIFRIHLKPIAGIEHEADDWGHPGVHEVVEEKRFVERIIWAQEDIKESTESIQF
jgi:hypothetical protein